MRCGALPSGLLPWWAAHWSFQSPSPSFSIWIFYGRSVARVIIMLPWAVSLTMTAIVWR
ncbi:sugar ABC transporter permease [Brucella vulpis]|nr:sugar ABC transporter permease [Brucella vulpis]CUW51301.1 sugar ABC transporter permease [Brucella vulpis]